MTTHILWQDWLDEDATRHVGFSRVERPGLSYAASVSQEIRLDDHVSTTPIRWGHGNTLQEAFERAYANLQACLEV